MKMVLGSRRWRCESDGMSGEREREREGGRTMWCEGKRRE